MWTLNKPEEEIKKLETEFSQLITIEEKFLFWSERLPFPFYRSPTCAFKVNFPIDGKTVEETERINLLNHKQYSERFDLLDMPVHDFEKMKDSFQGKYVNTVNQREYLESEIKSLEKKVAERDGHIDEIHDKTNSFFDKGYSDFYFENRKPDLGNEVIGIIKLVALMNGYVFAQYHNYLKGLLNKPVAKDKFTHIEQILILEYLCIVKKGTNDRRKAEIYAPIIQRDIETTRILFSSFWSDKTVKNMTVVYNYFDKNGLTDQAKEAKIELDKLNKRKK